MVISTCKPFTCLASPENADNALAEWLNFFSAGNHDDRTLVVALELLEDIMSIRACYHIDSIFGLCILFCFIEGNNISS